MCLFAFQNQYCEAIDPLLISTCFGLFYLSYLVLIYHYCVPVQGFLKTFVDLILLLVCILCGNMAICARLVFDQLMPTDTNLCVFSF